MKLNLVVIQKTTIKTFGLPIGNEIMNKKLWLRTGEPLIKYHQKRSNSCCLSSLASAFHCIGDNRDVSALVNHIEESLTLQTK